MDKETLKKILRDELIENKSINDYDSDDPFVGIYLDDLVDLIYNFNKSCNIING
jgi:hypothetical protein